MSDLLASLNNPGAAKEAESWEAEVAKAEAELKPPQEEKPPEPEVSRETPEEPAPRAETPPVEATPAPAEPKEDKQVPLKALHEEREARKALERKLAELEQRFTQPPAPQEEFIPPDPEVDPIGALKHDREMIAAFRQYMAEQNQQQQLTQYYSQSAQQFATQEPAFKEAYNFAIQSRAKELRAFGTPEHEINQAIAAEEMQIVAGAIRNGRNPAEVIYQLAEVRGFQKKAPEQKPAAAIAPAVDPAVQKAKADAATSLTTGGKPPANDLTDEEAIRTLKGAAYDSWAEKKWKAMEQAGGRKSTLFPN